MKISQLGWNFSGLALPLVVAVVTIPTILENLGQERFGLLALAWGLIGYAGTLDLGLGRALTQLVSSLRGEKSFSTIPDVLATANRITLFTGCVGSICIASLTLFDVVSWIGAIEITHEEVIISILLLSIALPMQAISSTYRGLNEAFLNFKGISLLRSFLGVINFGGPYCLSFFTTDLSIAIATLVASRLLAFLAYRSLAFSCMKREGIYHGKAQYIKSIASRLFVFGGWITVSSVISPILVQVDRFVIAGIMSAAAVSVYVLPYEVVLQTLIVVGAVTSVFFPELTRLIHANDDSWQSYFKTWLVRLILLMAVVCTMLIMFLPHILSLWLKDLLQNESILIGQILCIGVFFNSIGAMYYALLHAKGRSDITAKIHICELPFFIALLIFLVSSHGLIGAACAWTTRMVVDSIALIYCSRIKSV